MSKPKSAKAKASRKEQTITLPYQSAARDEPNTSTESWPSESLKPSTPSPLKTGYEQLRRRVLSARFAQNALLFSIITVLPVALSQKLWLEIWRGARPRAWDGTGHFAIAQIFDQTIFPDTFGWTHAYFAGMPFPNFYPPLFYWCVALLHHTGLFSFAAAFKLVLTIPVLLMPIAMWLLARTVSDNSRLAATGAALAATALMVDSRFLPFFPSGLDYFSTFQIGLYTQPLGFVLLMLWYVSYTSAHKSRLKFALSCLLLALTVLANFFNAITATLIIAATLASDLIQYRRAPDSNQKASERRALLVHLAAPLVAVGLTSFWLVPMLTQYDYFVTRPSIIEINKLVSPALLVWYFLAVIGIILWLRRPTRAMWPYLVTCFVLAACVMFAATIAPRWFPLQSSRFLTTLNFLLAVPVGQLIAAAFRAFAKLLGEIQTREQPLTLRQARHTTGTAVFVLMLLALTSPGPKSAYAFYPAGETADIDAVLDFARQHRDGRYIVEVINPAATDVSFDARAINSYLGAQGNETLSAVFHEASPNALFSLPLVNAFSNYPDSFGISSVLSDDIDFAAQPLAAHLDRARLMGARYLVIRSPAMKEQLSGETAILARHDFGTWGIFELKGGAQPHVRALAYRPALVLSPLTLKQRRGNEMSFIRLIEEQVADGWFDVLLARSPEMKIDRLNDTENFGAVILDTYGAEDENLAFERLRELAHRRALILLSSNAKLFQRIRASITEFPLAVIVERAVEEPSEILETIRPARHYQSSAIRQGWAAIRNVLDRTKIAVGPATITGETGQGSIQLNSAATVPDESIPTLIAMTYHPGWRRIDESPVYAITRFIC